MSRQNFQQFMNVLEEFDQVMLVTARDGDLRSRPMEIGDVTDDGRLRFITRDDSAKLEEVSESPQVNIAAQGDRQFLSISGTARLSKDRDLIDRAWKMQQTPWFADGKDDPHVIVLEVIPMHAEYWDRSESGIVKTLFAGAMAALEDDEPLDENTVGEHGKIDFSGKPL
jgi:general stress protein 26